jgi:TRAP-type C4-dicarboxylate transport system substrate-binding protein
MHTKETELNTRRILTSLAVAAAGLAIATAGHAAEKLIVTTNVPAVHWASTQGGEPFMKCVKEATKGDIDFNYFHSGQIAGFTKTLDAVNSGLAHISYIVVSAQTDKLPLNNISMLPELGATVVEMTRAYRKVIDANGLLMQEYTANRIRPLLINMFPPYQMLSRGEPLDTLEKIRGKKVSTGGGSLIVTLNKLGANAIEMTPGDIYLAMQQGTVDGTMLALASIKPYKLQEVIKSASFDASFGSAAGVWSIDTGVWARLSPANQKALTDCGIKVETELAKWADNFTEELKKELAGLGIKVHPMAPAARAAIAERLKQAREDYVSRVAARGLPAQKAYEEYLKALGQ